MHTESIEYHLDGTTYVGHLAVGDGATAAGRPGVLVAHEGPGLTDVTRSKAERLAEAGYVAFALDYHGGGRPLPMDQVMARLGPLRDDPDRIRALGRAGLAVLTARPEVDVTRLAAIGYCFGGTMALELARDGAPVQVVVGFHSGLATARPAAPGAIAATVLVCIGADDPLIPPQQRAAFEDEMRAAGADWRLALYGGAGHSFTNPDAGQFGRPGIEYHAATDARSWRAMLDVFEERFGSA